MFTMTYHCPGNLEYRRAHAPISWEDSWDSACNDKCPECNCEIEPSAVDESND